MKRLRGFSAIDLLMLVLLLSAGIVMVSLFAGNEPAQVLSLRYSSLQDKRALLAVLERRVSLNNSNAREIMRGRIVDIIAFQACNGCPANGSELDYCTPLNKAINSTLYSFNKGQKHYIFNAVSLARAVNFTVFDNVSSVCLENLPLARFSHNATCGEPLTIIYATWFPWQQVRSC